MATKLKVEPEFWDDQEWGIQHYGELINKYSGRWVAIVGRRVVSYGPDPIKVEAEASKKTGKPKESIPLMYIEAGNQIF